MAGEKTGIEHRVDHAPIEVASDGHAERVKDGWRDVEHASVGPGANLDAGTQRRQRAPAFVQSTGW